MKKSKKVSDVMTIVSRRLRARLARWWIELNCWTIPADFPKHHGFATEEERRQFIRGAFVGACGWVRQNNGVSEL